jgi:hypothetical protein
MLFSGIGARRFIILLMFCYSASATLHIDYGDGKVIDCNSYNKLYISLNKMYINSNDCSASNADDSGVDSGIGSRTYFLASQNKFIVDQSSIVKFYKEDNETGCRQYIDRGNDYLMCFGTNTTYVPGCINGLDFRAIKCDSETKYKDNKTNKYITLNNIIGIRYLSNNDAPNMRNSGKIIIKRMDNEGLSITLKAWISSDIRTTYDQTDDKCKVTGNGILEIETGTTKCVIDKRQMLIYLNLQAPDDCKDSEDPYLCSIKVENVSEDLI